MNRHGRQARLVEVGAAGQQRIEAARVTVPLDGVAASVAARYLAGAGIACLRVAGVQAAAEAQAVDPGLRVEVDPALPRSTSASPFGLRDRDADAVALGAHTALVALRGALGVGG
jgi:hypothetical protein